MSRQQNADVVILGGGPAGLNAALVLGRACKKVIIADEGRHRNRRADYGYGFLTRDGVPPAEFLATGRRQLAPYDVTFIPGRAVAVERKDASFAVTLADGSAISGGRLILATGVTDLLPDLPGMAGFWGRGIFSCPYCDGWESRKSRVAVLGSGKKGFEFSLLVQGWCREVTLCLNGGAAPDPQQMDYLREREIPVIAEPIAEFCGAAGGALQGMIFKNGRRLDCGAVFFRAGAAGPDPLAAQLGCRLQDDGAEIATDGAGRTSVPGVYAAGDRSTRHHLLITAAASGAVAAYAVNEDICEERHGLSRR